ncbi:hypothetical protein [Paenarthrobacter sp. CAP02]
MSNVLEDAGSNLRIEFIDAPSLTVSGEPTATTVGDPWWLRDLTR